VSTSPLTRIDKAAPAEAAAPAPAPARRALGRRLLRALPLLLLPLLGLTLWQAADWIFDPRPWLLPGPVEVGEVLWGERASLWHHAQATIAETLLGLALATVAGLGLAVAITASRAVERSVYPWVVASQTIPILAVAPLFAVWVDYGVAQLLVAALFCFFPIVVTGVDGLRSADPEHVRMLRTLGAGRAEVWRHALLPAALGPLFSGLRLAAVFAVTGAVVAEYVGADRGLGYLSEISTGQFQTVLTFAAVAWLAVIGVALFALVALAERLALPHRHRPARRPRSPR